jgi:hypothetical protein
MITMPFGKHRGEFLVDIPTNYLAWVLRDCETAEWWLREAVQVEMERRIHETPPARGQRRGEERTGMMQVGDIIKRWWREMALRFHPDRGGDTKVMQAMNEAHERLKELAGLQ